MNKTLTRITPSLIGQCLGRGWSASIDPSTYQVILTTDDGVMTSYPVGSIRAVALKKWMLFTDIVITLQAEQQVQTVVLPTASGDQVSRFMEEVSLLQRVRPLMPMLAQSITRASGRLAQLDYISRCEFEELIQVPQAELHAVRAACRAGLLNVDGIDLSALLRQFDDVSGDTLRQQHNDTFLASEGDRYQSFFDDIEKSPLTQEQRRAIMIHERRNLVVACAGSGKTSVVVGKVAYLIASGQLKPTEIVALAYNDKAAREMNSRFASRINSRLDLHQSVTATTFHALGLAIIAQAIGYKPSVCADMEEAIRDCITDLRREDPSFSKDWNRFAALYARVVRPQTDFDDLESYESYLRSCGARRKNDEQLRIRTLQGEMVASLEEATIANWLFVNGVRYEYEKQYPYPTGSIEYRQYQPDFYYPDADLFHEHWGCDLLGKPAAFLGDGYAESMRWKLELHQARGTKLIETCSGQFTRGDILPRLKDVLQKHNVPFAPISTERLEAALEENARAILSTEALCMRFIHHMKSNRQTVAEIAGKLNQPSGRESLFLRLMSRIEIRYGRYLKEHRKIDFDDMINLAAHYLITGQAKVPYKCIIVDEYQDTSPARSNLVDALLNQHEHSTLMAVGDDWQSIYRFAGSDINCMTAFEQRMRHPAILMLTRTFRSNQGITSAASSFVMANPLQLKKQVDAIDSVTADVIDVVLYNRKEQQAAFIEQRLDRIANGTPKPLTVFILGRYNADEKGLDMIALNRRYRGRLSIQFLTVHRAKGLEADVVFVLGLKNGAFPSVTADDSLLGLVMPKSENFLFAEERRLFYVALTRAKKHVYLLAKQGEESPFVHEILARSAEGSIRRSVIDRQGMYVSAEEVLWCPACVTGHQIVRNGPSGLFLGCSQYPACEETASLSRISIA